MGSWCSTDGKFQLQKTNIPQSPCNVVLELTKPECAPMGLSTSRPHVKCSDHSNKKRQVGQPGRENRSKGDRERCSNLSPVQRSLGKWPGHPGVHGQAGSVAQHSWEQRGGRSYKSAGCNLGGQPSLQVPTPLRPRITTNPEPGSPHHPQQSAASSATSRGLRQPPLVPLLKGNHCF